MTSRKELYTKCKDSCVLERDDYQILITCFPLRVMLLTNDHIFCVRQIPKKKREYNEAVHQMFIDFKKAYDSIRREVLYNILIEIGIPMKLVRLIKMCLTETYSRIQVGQHLPDMFLIENGFKEEDALSPLFFIFALGYALKMVQTNQYGLKLNGTLQVWLC